MEEPKIHKSVMVDAAVAALHIKNQARYIDATLGTGGHTLEILRQGGTVLGFDLDPELVNKAEERLKNEFGSEGYILKIGNFSEMGRSAAELGWDQVSGVIFDLGVSNLHLKDLERGFSFSNPAARLDMRLNKDLMGVSAADLLNVLRFDQLENLFAEVLEKSASRWMAKRVIERREIFKFENVGDLLEICEGLKTGKAGMHVATLPFLALRMAVNMELDNLREALPVAYKLLESGGRIAVITFHSGEEKIVKKFSKEVMGKEAEAIYPDSVEINDNPRSRSARLRIIEKP